MAHPSQGPLEGALTWAKLRPMGANNAKISRSNTPKEWTSGRCRVIDLVLILVTKEYGNKSALASTGSVYTLLLLEAAWKLTGPLWTLFVRIALTSG